MYRYIPIIFILVVLIFQILSFGQGTNQKGLYMVLGDQKFQTEIVDTPSLRNKGLSGRDSLCANCAMLFVFENEGDYRFWMRDMKFPIDIIWLNKEGQIIYRKENLNPDTFPQTFGIGEGQNKNKSLYVVEVPSGSYNKYNLYIGQKILSK